MFLIQHWLWITLYLSESAFWKCTSSSAEQLSLVEEVSDCIKCMMLKNVAAEFCIVAATGATSHNFSLVCSSSELCTLGTYFQWKISKIGNSSPGIMDIFPYCPTFYHRLRLPFRPPLIPDPIFWEKSVFFKRFLTGLTGSECYKFYETFVVHLFTLQNESRDTSRDSMCTPYSCLCNVIPNQVGYSITLDFWNYSSISKEIFINSDYGTLIIDGGVLEMVAAEALRGLGHLRELKILRNLLNNDIFQALRNLPKLEVLSIKHNEITDICDTCLLGLNSLTTLELPFNKIRELLTGMQHVTFLNTLDLSGNFISVISEEFFLPLNQLQVLDLSKNILRTFANNIFINNMHLISLDLSGSKLTKLPNLSYLRRLEKLSVEVHEFEGRDSDVLCNFSSLQYLKVSCKHWVNISFHILNCEHKLKEVNLSLSSVEQWSMFKDIGAKFVGLSGSVIDYFTFDHVSPNILRLDLSHSKIFEWRPIETHMIPVDRLLQIKELILSFNWLEVLRDIQIPVSLKILDLSDNMIEYISFKNWSEIALLRTLNLRNNKFSTVCPLLLHALPITKARNSPYINLNNNPLGCSCEMDTLKHFNDDFESDVPGNLHLCPIKSNSRDSSMSSSLLSGIDHDIHFECTSDPKYCSCNANPYYVTKCDLPCPAPCSCYVNGTYDGYIIICSQMNLTSVPNVMTLPISASVILSGNLLDNVTSGALAPFIRAHKLHLDRNRLKVLSANSFMNFEALRLLNLSNNELQTLPAQVFWPLKESLEMLYLSNNQLSTLDEDVFCNLTHLNILHLHNNHLTIFPEWKLQPLTLKSNGLTLTNNPWSCECDNFLRFQEWLKNSHHLVQNASDLSCQQNLDGGHHIPFLSSSDYCMPTVHSIWISIIVLSIVTFISTLCIIVYLYRQEVQVLIYSRYGIRVFQKNRLQDEDKVYDAFIAYSGNDEQFVAEQLIPGLEQIENPYRVCVHHRDFLVGALITESILEAVDKSCRTIIILSESFVNSGWCRFEFKTAHCSSLCDRVARLIVVVLDKVPNGCDTEMQLYLKTNTYLQWGDKLFWKKLYYALPDRKPKTATT